MSVFANSEFLWKFRSLGYKVYNNIRNNIECNIGVTISDDWKTSYLKIIQDFHKKYSVNYSDEVMKETFDNYALVYIDNDDIPELYIYSQICLLYTFHNCKVIRDSAVGGIRWTIQKYSERNGLMYIYCSGGAACGIKKYQTLENGRFITNGSFHHCARINNDTGIYEPYFTIDDEYGKEVKEEIYNQELKKAEDKFCQNDITNLANVKYYTYSEIVDVLEDNKDF